MSTFKTFTTYYSKPVTRAAIQIENDEPIYTDQDSSCGFVYRSIRFNATVVPVVGDYIVRIDVKDTYHVPRDVFRERNIVPETDI